MKVDRPECALERTTEDRVAASINSAIAGWTFAREAYDRLFAFIAESSRHSWGALFALLLDGWNEAGQMLAARALLNEVVEEVVTTGEKLKSDPGRLITIATGLSFVGCLRLAVERRIGELRDAEAATAAVAETTVPGAA